MFQPSMYLTPLKDVFPTVLSILQQQLSKKFRKAAHTCAPVCLEVPPAWKCPAMMWLCSICLSSLSASILSVCLFVSIPASCMLHQADWFLSQNTHVLLACFLPDCVSLLPHCLPCVPVRPACKFIIMPAWKVPCLYVCPRCVLPIYVFLTLLS